MIFAGDDLNNLVTWGMIIKIQVDYWCLERFDADIIWFMTLFKWEGCALQHWIQQIQNYYKQTYERRKSFRGRNYTIDNNSFYKVKSMNVCTFKPL